MSVRGTGLAHGGEVGGKRPSCRLSCPSASLTAQHNDGFYLRARVRRSRLITTLKSETCATDSNFST